MPVAPARTALLTCTTHTPVDLCPWCHPPAPLFYSLMGLESSPLLARALAELRAKGWKSPHGSDTELEDEV